jgi:hypothetical protein
MSTNGKLTPRKSEPGAIVPLTNDHTWLDIIIRLGKIAVLNSFMFYFAFSTLMFDVELKFRFLVFFSSFSKLFVIAK